MRMPRGGKSGLECTRDGISGCTLPIHRAHTSTEASVSRRFAVGLVRCGNSRSDVELTEASSHPACHARYSCARDLTVDLRRLNFNSEYHMDGGHLPEARESGEARGLPPGRTSYFLRDIFIDRPVPVASDHQILSSGTRAARAAGSASDSSQTRRYTQPLAATGGWANNLLSYSFARRPVCSTGAGALVSG